MTETLVLPFGAAPVPSSDADVERRVTSLLASRSQASEVSAVSVPRLRSTAPTSRPSGVDATGVTVHDLGPGRFSSRTTMAFDTGVLLPRAVLASGISTFASGKYAAAQPREVG